MIWRWLRPWFCRHHWRFFRRIHGDEILWTGCRTVVKCSKCKSYRYLRNMERESYERGRP